MERNTFFDHKFNLETFTARGEIAINENILSFDFQNGIASFRFIKRRDRDSVIIDTLSGKWNHFYDYIIKEHGNENKDSLSAGFDALLYFGYYQDNRICFYIDSILDNYVEDEIYTVEIFSQCLMNHFEQGMEFDFNTFGYVNDSSCAEININDANIKVYCVVAVEWQKSKMQKKFLGGFRFVSNIYFTPDLIKKCVDAVNEYCCFLLNNSGFFISNVEIISPEDGIMHHRFFCKKENEIFSDVAFSYNDIKSVFNNLITLFFEKSNRFSELYTITSNVYQRLDIIRIASMFENQYRINLADKMDDYVNFEIECYNKKNYTKKKQRQCLLKFM
jgi:hypothetical protein